MRLKRSGSAWLLASLALLAALPLQALELTQALRAQLMEAVTTSAIAEDDWDARVWLVAKDTRLREFVADEELRLKLLHMVHEEAERTGLPAELILAVIEVESGFDPYAVSSAGAQGLMQVMSFWKLELGREHDNLTDIRTNLRYGCTILAYYQDMEDGDLEDALARYNGSYGQSWYPRRVMQAMSKWR